MPNSDDPNQLQQNTTSFLPLFSYTAIAIVGFTAGYVARALNEETEKKRNRILKKEANRLYEAERQH